MLAYLDNMLEASDYRDIGQKIAESEAAAKLVQRTRDVMVHPRLSAPRVSARGVGLDPNSVAEYLEDVLPSDRVTDFERICLESDVHLAEVASCHHILTMVLTKPADIDADVKRRMKDVIHGRPAKLSKAPDLMATRPAPDYDGPPPPKVAAAGASAAAAGLASSLDAAVAANGHGAAQITPAGDFSHSKPTREKPQVPEWLREPARGRSRFWPIAFVMLAFMLGIAVAMSIGPWNASLMRMFGMKGSEPAPHSTDGKDIAKFTPDGAKVTPDGAKVTPDGAKDTAAPKDSGSDSASRPATAGDGQAIVAPPALKDDSHGKDPKAAGSATAGGADSGGPSPARPAHSIVGHQPPANGPLEPELLPKAGPDKAGPDQVASDKVGPDKAPVTIDPLLDPPAKPIDPGKIDAAAGRPIGRFTSDGSQVLLRLAGDKWLRMLAKEGILAGDTLLVLPTFKPEFIIGPGISVQLQGDTLIQIEQPDADGVYGIRLHYGRLLMFSVPPVAGQPDTRLRLTLGDKPGLIALGAGEPILGVEVRRYLSPGKDPEHEIAKVAAEIYMISGQTTWQSLERSRDGDVARPELLKKPMRFVVSAHPNDPPRKEIPAWIANTEDVRSSDQSASLELNRILDEKRPVALALKEAANHRRSEIRSLAGRCLALTGDFEPIIRNFSDQDQRAVWPTYVESLQSALALGPVAAKLLHETLVRMRGDDGEKMYRVLWGFTKADLTEGGWATRLVAMLDNENLDIRVLAFLTLKSITGETRSYSPQSLAAPRQASIRRWAEAAKAGTIVPKNAAADKAAVEKPPAPLDRSAPAKSTEPTPLP